MKFIVYYNKSYRLRLNDYCNKLFIKQITTKYFKLIIKPLVNNEITASFCP